MKLNYEIYGYILNLEFKNDLLLLEHIKNQVGKVIDQNANIETHFVFKKTSALELRTLYEHFSFDSKRDVFVEPTQEYAIVGYSNSRQTIVHFYDTYYLIVFLSNEKKVDFYYCDNFFNIDFLLMEFFKYCIFPVMMNDAWVPLHSSCVISSTSGNTILFVGDSGCGKSSNALLMALNFEYWFCNDEVTYLTYRDGEFFVNTTRDKVKICRAMYDSLLENNIEFEVTQIEDEYICDVSVMRRKDDNLFPNKNLQIDMIFLLKRDDSERNMRIYEPDVIEKYRCLIQNCNISIWTTREHKRVIMNMIDKLIKEVRVVSVVYPTKDITNVSKLIEEKCHEYKN